MVGSRAEQGGIIKDGAELVNAVANSVVPKTSAAIAVMGTTLATSTLPSEWLSAALLQRRSVLY